MFDLELFFQPPEGPIMPPGQGVSSWSIAPFTGIYLQKHSSMHKKKVHLVGVYGLVFEYKF